MTAGAVALVLVGLALLVLAVRMAQRPSHLLTADEHLAGWQHLHDGVDPRASVWVSGWLRLVRVLAGPLAARGVSPDVVTGLALWTSAWVLWAALADQLVVAAVLLLVSAVLDGLDGAVAVLSGRTSARGRVLDTVADRVSELLWLGAALAAGARPWVVLLAVLAVGALEGTRVVLGRVVRVTAAERPTRVIVLVPSLLPIGDDWTTVGVAVLVGLTLGGLTQLALALRDERGSLPA